MTSPRTLLVCDETITTAGAEGWSRHLEPSGEPTEMFRLGGTLVLSVSDGELIGKAGDLLPEPTHQVLTTGDVWLGRREIRPGGPESPWAASRSATVRSQSSVIIDVHVQPEQALCDGNQALRPRQFADSMRRLAPMVAGLGRHMSSGE